MKQIKVNLAYDDWSFREGVGEGIWGGLTAINRWKLEHAGECHVYAQNNSLYYPGLVVGKRVHIQYRGEHERPVAFPEDLVKQFGASRRDEVQRFVENAWDDEGWIMHNYPNCNTHTPHASSRSNGSGCWRRES